MRYPHLESIQAEAEKVAKDWGLKPKTFTAIWSRESRDELEPGQKGYISDMGMWESKVKGGKIILNAMAIRPDEVRNRIRHEMAHLVYEDRDVKNALGRLFQSLPEKTRKDIETQISAHYDEPAKKEEAQVRAFELLTNNAPPSLFGKLIKVIEDAWNRITNQNSIPRAEEQQLLTAVFNKGIEKLRELVQDIPPLTKMNEFQEVMEQAGSEGNMPILKACVEQLKDYPFANILLKTAMISAAGSGQTQAVGFLIDKGADIEAYSGTAMRDAASKGHTDTVRLLLDNGAELHGNQEEPLRMAAYYGHSDTAEMLIHYGANVRELGHKALHSAVVMDETHTTETMLSKYKTGDLKDLLLQDWLPKDLEKSVQAKILERQKPKKEQALEM